MEEGSRGLDHLMEQNETELDFLSAYGGVGSDTEVDGLALLEALRRFLKAGGVACKHDEHTLEFAFGRAEAGDDGCLLSVVGIHLPLVNSDLHAPGFRDGQLATDRSTMEVWLTQWSSAQRRLIERLVEHHRLEAS